ncbi:MAG TPA: hypothetical protein VFX09_02240 [Burkholderiales bacterium]|nr:hypothetical protein [Burkholderiales bacterium]
MRSAVFAALLLVHLSAPAQQQEINRALIQRDQQSADFAAAVRGASVPPGLAATQQREALIPLSPDAAAGRLLPYQRQRMAEEYVLRLPPPVVRVPAQPEERAPLPLPGGLPRAVEPVTPGGASG